MRLHPINSPSQLPSKLSPPSSVAKPDYLGYSGPSTTGRDPYYSVYQSIQNEQSPAPVPTPSNPWKKITSRPMLFPNPSVNTQVNGVTLLNGVTFTTIVTTLLSLTLFTIIRDESFYYF